MNRAISRLLGFAASMTLLAAGASCARYEYDVLQPQLPEPRAGTRDDLIVDIDPLRYRFRTVDNRLVMRVFNPTPEPIRLLGDKSSVTDPIGQARPVRSQTIPPGAFVKFILPPVRPEFVGRGGSVGLGVGVSSGGGYYGPGVGRREYGFGGYDEPAAYTLRDGGEFYWDWQGESSARMTLVFDRAGTEIKHELLLGRRRAN